MGVLTLLCFQESKSALYWAVEKGNSTMVRDILQCNPDTEICTKVRPRPPVCQCMMSQRGECVLVCDIRTVRRRSSKPPK